MFFDRSFQISKNTNTLNKYSIRIKIQLDIHKIVGCQIDFTILYIIIHQINNNKRKKKSILWQQLVNNTTVLIYIYSFLL